MFTELLSTTYDALLSLVNSAGYLGILILMTIESSFIPFPSELILIPAGALIAKGVFDPTLVIAASLIGVLFGALINYYLALHLGRRVINKLLTKYGRLFLLKPEHLVKSEVYFKKHGEIAMFAGRLFPGIRSFISIPAGFYKMDLTKFCLFTVLGAIIPNITLIGLGYFIGSYENVAKQYLLQITLAMVGLALSIVVIYILIKKLQVRRTHFAHQ